jgi:hypothetical protein
MYNPSAMRLQGVLLLLAAAALPARSQTLPPLDAQKTWTDADKKEFLKFLNSNAPLPSGQVKAIAAARTEPAYSGPARAFEIGPAATSLFPYAGTGRASHAVSLPGGRILYERHYRPWLRGYVGVEGEDLRQKRLDGQTATLTRGAVPVGVEFALVPLDTPQTRCVLLRAGVVASDVTGPGRRGDFYAPVLGASAAWDVGLGYEWQIPDSRWRLNGAVDGLHSISNSHGVGYYGLGLSAAVAYTF